MELAQGRIQYRALHNISGVEPSSSNTRETAGLIGLEAYAALCKVQFLCG
jgi:hypothetical protein